MNKKSIKEKTDLFNQAHAQLRIALMNAEAIKENPLTSIDAVARLTNSIAKANALALMFDSAMRSDSETITSDSRTSR